MKFSIRLFLCIIFLLSAFILPALGQKSKQVQRLEKQRKEALKAIEKTDRELRNTKKDKQDKQKHQPPEQAGCSTQADGTTLGQ